MIKTSNAKRSDHSNPKFASDLIFICLHVSLYQALVVRPSVHHIPFLLFLPKKAEGISANLGKMQQRTFVRNCTVSSKHAQFFQNHMSNLILLRIEHCDIGTDRQSLLSRGDRWTHLKTDKLPTWPDERAKPNHKARYSLWSRNRKNSKHIIFFRNELNCTRVLYQKLTSNPHQDYHQKHQLERVQFKDKTTVN